nr:hypothetical protein [uncultured Flavobacterium sp.]
MQFLKNILSKLWKAFIDYLYLVLLVCSIIYFIYYLCVIFNATKNFESTPTFKVLSLIKDLAIISFSAGIFTAALKFLAFIKVFESEFEKLFQSKNYGGIIKEGIESITLSKEYLARQTNIKQIWKDVTLCMYKEKFPELHDKIENVITNKYFDNLAYYYKTEHITYKISSVENDFIKIEQTIIYTLKRATTEEFNWSCAVVFLPDDEYPDYPILEIDFLDNPTKFNSESHINVTKEGNLITKRATVPLSGQKEYRIKRKIVEMQNYKEDRVWSFQSENIIESMDVSVKYTSDLNVIFTESLVTNFTPVEKKQGSQSYTSKHVLLPGEQFKLFFLKN